MSELPSLPAAEPARGVRWPLALCGALVLSVAMSRVIDWTILEAVRSRFARGLDASRVRRVSLPLSQPPWGWQQRGQGYVAEGLGPSYLVRSPDGRHVFAMISALPVAAELSRTAAGQRAGVKTMRAKFPRRGMYVLSGGKATLLWGSKYGYVADPAAVLVPDGGERMMWLHGASPGWTYPTTLGFCVKGEGTGDRALARLGSGGQPGAQVLLGMREETVEVMLPGMGWFVLAQEDGALLSKDRMFLLRGVAWGWYAIGLLVLLVRLRRGTRLTNPVELIVWIGLLACGVGLLMP